MRRDGLDHNIERRQFMKYAGTTATVALTGLAGCAGSDDNSGGSGGNGGNNGFPENDLRYIIPFSEGGGTDTYARQIIPAMDEEFESSIAVENIPGAASLRGTGELFYADPDGHTYGGFNPPSTPVSAMVNPPDFDMQQLKGVGSYARTPFIIVANPQHGIENFEDLKGRYDSGELGTFGGKERGGVDHVLALLMKNNEEYAFGWDRYVGYDGSGPAVQATVSGEIPAAISTDTAAQAAVQGGRVDTVVGLSSEGTQVFPDLQSVVDEGYPNIDYLGQLRRGMFVPPETPDGPIQELTSTLETALQKQSVQEWSENTGNVVEYGGPETAEEAVTDAFNNIPDQVDLEQVRQETG